MTRDTASLTPTTTLTEEEEEEDTELRDLVLGALNANGMLGKIKAQLRSSVFLALDDDQESTVRNSTMSALVG